MGLLYFLDRVSYYEHLELLFVFFLFNLNLLYFLKF